MNLTMLPTYRILLCLIPVMLLTLTQSCTPPPAIQPPLAAYDEAAVERLLAQLEQQARLVTSIAGTGALIVGQEEDQSRLSLLLAARRQPLQLKIEITHPWGRPVLHCLVEGNQVKMLSFRDKRLLVGDLRDPIFKPYLTGTMNSSQLWTLARGYPMLEQHHRATSLKPQAISLRDQAGREVQGLAFDALDQLPLMAWFPEHDLRMIFDRFNTAGPIQYAQRLRLENISGIGFIEFRLEVVQLNRLLPDSVFTLDVPPDYQTARLHPGSWGP